mgnify:CR=1 FL=1
MEWFRDDGCMTEAGLRALLDGQLDEMGRLEAAEHLSYCDHCMDRYTALLTADALESAPRGMHSAVMGGVWARLMQNTYGRAAVAGVAAVLALTMWRSGTLGQITQFGCQLQTLCPTVQSQQETNTENALPFQPVENTRPAQQMPTGKPVQTGRDRRYASERTSLLQKLFSGVTQKAADTAQDTEK